ncbi:MAG: RNA polymerase sigma factor [Anaerolineae bacterium]
MATNDQMLLEQARQYDSQALAEIYDLYSLSIYHYLYRFVGEAHTAEDLTSEVFLKLIHVLDTTRAPRDQLQGWLYRVARNLAVDWYRKRGRQEPLSLREDLVPSGESPLAKLEKDQDRQRLRKALLALTPDQQQVLLLRFAQELKIEEVAQILGKSEGAVKLLQYRATRRLQKLLEREEKSDVEQTSRAVRGVPAASGAGRDN